MSLCVSIGPASLEQMQTDCAAALADGADLVEVRLDYLEPEALRRLGDLEPWFQRHVDKLVLSLRPLEQGGLFDGHTADRLSTLLWASSFRPALLDVEYPSFVQSREAAEKVEASFASADCDHWPRLLFSEHHLEHRPHKLHNKFMYMSGSPAEVIKLVWRARNATDNFEALDLLRSSSRPATVFCSGSDGLPSRVLGRKFGAALTYCSLRPGQETADGQPTLAEMLDRYRWRAINEHSAVYGLIGNPVAHSLSPHIHNAALEACGLNAVYVPFRVDDDGYAFADFIKSVAERPWLDVRGFSVTTPHKHHAWLLAEDELDPITRRIGAVNTLRFAEGSVTGTNTDYQAATHWVTAGLRCDLPDLADMKFDILGAGGLARAVVVALRVLKADVTIYNRNLERARTLAEEFDCRSERLDASAACQGHALINCTAAGMWPETAASPVTAEQLNPQSVVFDAVYNPLETQLLKNAAERGCRTVSGLDLFIDQAVMQFTALTGRLAPREVMHETALRHLRR